LLKLEAGKVEFEMLGTEELLQFWAGVRVGNDEGGTVDDMVELQFVPEDVLYIVDVGVYGVAVAEEQLEVWTEYADDGPYDRTAKAELIFWGKYADNEESAAGEYKLEFWAIVAKGMPYEESGTISDTEEFWTEDADVAAPYEGGVVGTDTDEFWTVYAAVEGVGKEGGAKE
jgi:hypothetical protein